jgi:hypothetical protein
MKLKRRRRPHGKPREISLKLRKRHKRLSRRRRRRLPKRNKRLLLKPKLWLSRRRRMSQLEPVTKTPLPSQPAQPRVRSVPVAVVVARQRSRKLQVLTMRVPTKSSLSEICHGYVLRFAHETHC